MPSDDDFFVDTIERAGVQQSTLWVKFFMDIPQDMKNEFMGV